MAAFTALALGLAGGALIGAIARKKKGKLSEQVQAPAPTPEATPEQKVAATSPVQAMPSLSAAVASSGSAAQRTRRRAAAGSAGKASGGVKSPQVGISAGGSPRSLLGS